MASSQAVLCALDDTEVSSHALRASAWLARELGASVVAVHVFDPMGIPVGPRGEMMAVTPGDEDLERAARSAAQRLVVETALEAWGVEVETELIEGGPADELLRRATEMRPGLLVCGTATRPGMDRLLVGSVASELAARAPCPVVTVARGAALEEPGPVLAGYDGSEHSLRAARHAASLAARLKRALVLLHVSDGDERVDVDRRLADELATAAIDGLGESPDRPPLDLKVTVAVEEGDPVEVVSQVARERSAALVVVGTRGRGALRAALLGSVSARLARTAGRPVAVVPATAG